MACASTGSLAPRTTGAGARRSHFVPASAYEAYVRGELLLATGKPQEAAAQLELATTAPDEDAYLLSRLAEAYALGGDRKLAEQTLREAERVNPCEQNVWMTRGSWAEREKQLDAALQAYERALRCDSQALPAALGSYRVLGARGEQARGLSLLAELAARDGATAARAAFKAALDTAKPAEARYALDSWLSSGSSEPELLEAMRQRALDKREPTLLWLASELPTAMPPAQLAELRRLTLDDRGLRALLAQLPETQLGGAAQAAELAQAAGDYERAELYAALALQDAPTAALRALHVRALLALGEHERALSELRALSASERAQLTREALSGVGLPALGSELTAQ